MGVHGGTELGVVTRFPTEMYCHHRLDTVALDLNLHASFAHMDD